MPVLQDVVFFLSSLPLVSGAVLASLYHPIAGSGSEYFLEDEGCFVSSLEIGEVVVLLVLIVPNLLFSSGHPP